MSLDPDLSNFLAMVAQSDMPAFQTLSPADARLGARGFAQWLNQNRPPLPSIETQDLRLGTHAVPARAYIPAGQAAQPGPAILYFHGGGWVIGDLETHDIFCRLFADQTGCRIIAVDYRLAPEHPFPAAVDDAAMALFASLEAPARYGIDPARLAVGGDSAGATLATVIAHMARDRDISLALQLLLYPGTDHIGDYPSKRTFAEGYFFSMDEAHWCLDHYLPDKTCRGDPSASPLHAERLDGLAPAIIITAGFDPLQDEGKAYADALDAAGVDVTAMHFETLIHGFVLMDAISAGVADALRNIATLVRERLAG